LSILNYEEFSRLREEFVIPGDNLTTEVVSTVSIAAEEAPMQFSII